MNLKVFLIENNSHNINTLLKKHPNGVNNNIYKCIHTIIKIIVKNVKHTGKQKEYKSFHIFPENKKNINHFIYFLLKSIN